MDKKWKTVVMVLIVLFAISFILSSFISFVTVGVPISGNVAVIPVKGVIVTDGANQLFGESTAGATRIVEYIKKADANPNIKAMIIEINSPGGYPVASDEIATALKNSNKTKIAWIREVGASGGYWVASACDVIVANRMSITGSIGVIGSYLEFSGLLNRYNVTYQRFVSGKYKDLASPYKNPSIEERLLFQKQIDMLHDFFVQEVADNRNLTLEEVQDIATGMFYIGADAQKLGLVDVLGGKEEVLGIIQNKHNITVELAEYKERRGFLDVFAGALNEKSFYIGEGIGSALFRKTNSPTIGLI